jgi:oligopeptide transport system substrate-binding protein
MWKQVLNVDVNIEQQEWKVYLQTLLPSSPDADKPEIYRMRWCADYMDANNYLNDVFNSKSDQNYAKFNDPEYDQIVQQAQVEQDPAKRKELYKQAEIILNNKVTAIAPIYFYTKVNLQKPYMTIITNPLSMDNVWKWKIDVAAKDAARKK